MKLGGWLIIVLFVITSCGISFLAGRYLPAAGKEDSQQIITIRDTVTRYDTIRIIQPPAVKEIFKEKVVEKFAVRTDTVLLHDSVSVEIPFTQRIYTDSTYRVVISGYKAQLDSLEIYYKNTTVTNEVLIPKISKKKANWSLGIQVGYGTDFQKFSPYIGIGVQYNILSW